MAHPAEPRGPLVARWLGAKPPAVHAGAPFAVLVEVENAGTAAWRSLADKGIQLSYHWIDGRGNAIVWDGERAPLPVPVEPGRRVRLPVRGRGPMPPGRYLLAIDLVEELRFWFEDVGNAPLLLEVEVRARIERRLAVRGGDPAALAAQEERLVPEDEAEAVAHLPAGAAPAAHWSRRVLDAHQHGYGVVGAAVEARGGLLRRRPRDLAAWAPGGGRKPHFPHPFVCPSVAHDAEVEWIDHVAGLPALRPAEDEPALFDGRIVVRLT